MLDERLVLRPSVAIRESTDGFLVRYAHWEMRVPASDVETNAALRTLAVERAVSQQVESATLGVVSLLQAQGCFVPAIGEDLNLADILRLFQPLRSELYAAYYAHPLWGALRDGSAPIGQLAAWALHNYHISRSAGVIAARLASQPVGPSQRQFFRDDALEEFWHCDAFYFVTGGRVPIGAASAKAYVPLPAIRAFEDVALRAAETDWLAHLLIAYFQESSIAFGEESERFYDVVEDRYDIPGFFAGWRRHLALDREHDHAGGLAALFKADQSVSRDMAEQSLAVVRLAHHYLVAALDQVMASPTEVESAVAQRQPLAIAAAPRETAIAIAIADSWRPYLSRQLEEAAFVALAHVRDHDSIMLAGNLAAALRDMNRDMNGSTGTDALDPLANPWLAAAGTFLLEQGRDLRTLLALAQDFAADITVETHGSARLRLASSPAPVPATNAVHVAVARWQLREFLELAHRSTPLEPLVIGRGIAM